MKRTTWILCLAACLLLLGIAVAAQLAQEEKSVATQASTQSHLAYQKMECSEALTQQMVQNQHHYQKKNQIKTLRRKMTQSGGGNSGGNGNHGQQSSQRGGRNGGGNG